MNTEQKIYAWRREIPAALMFYLFSLYASFKGVFSINSALISEEKISMWLSNIPVELYI